MRIKHKHPLFTIAHLCQKGNEVKMVAEVNIPDNPTDNDEAWFLYHPRALKHHASGATHTRLETPFTVLVKDGAGGVELLWSNEDEVYRKAALVNMRVAAEAG